MIATDRIAAAAQIDLSYLPVGANVHARLARGFSTTRESSAETA